MSDVLTALLPVLPASHKGKVFVPAAIVARVTAGAAHLDTYYPTWVDVVDLDRLDLSSTCRCVLGQIVQSVDDDTPNHEAYGRLIVRPWDDQPQAPFSLRDAVMSQADAIARGFHLADNESGKNWELFNVAWRREIKRRRINAKKRAAILADWMNHFPSQSGI